MSHTLKSTNMLHTFHIQCYKLMLGFSIIKGHVPCFILMNTSVMISSVIYASLVYVDVCHSCWSHLTATMQDIMKSLIFCARPAFLQQNHFLLINIIFTRLHWPSWSFQITLEFIILMNYLLPFRIITLCGLESSALCSLMEKWQHGQTWNKN